MNLAAVITDSFRLANHIEAGLWFLIALVFVIQSLRLIGKPRTDCIILAITFALFGGSDVVEAGTGAWWDPWWLLVWKAGCITIFAIMFWRWNAKRKQSP